MRCLYDLSDSIVKKRRPPLKGAGAIRGLNLSQIGENWGFLGWGQVFLPAKPCQRAGGWISQVAEQPGPIQRNEDIPVYLGQAVGLVDAGVPELLGILYRDGIVVKHAEQIMAAAGGRPLAIPAADVQRVVPAVAGYLKKPAQLSVFTDKRGNHTCHLKRPAG